MGRIIKVVIYALIILIVYFWVTAILRSSKNNQEQEQKNEIVTDTTAFSQNSMEMTDEETDFISNEDIVSGKIPYKDVDKTIEELSGNKAVPKSGTPANPSVPKTEANDKKQPTLQTEKTRPAVKQETPEQVTVGLGEEGDYLVIAGSYILEDNANKMVKKLRDMGFSNAGVVVFDASEYYSVVAVRHKTQDKAQLSSDALKRKGIDSFVKKKS
jgi:cell division septation protein DedD